MIEVHGMNKSFGAVKAVDDLSFEVKPGQIVGLLGPNGAGKTTTMRCMCGISAPDSGSVRIKGIELEEDPKAAKARLAFVPAEPRLFDYLTVREHLEFFSRLYGAALKKDKPYHETLKRQTKLADSLIEDLELRDRANYLPGALSRGMKQKLMIACALVHEPEILIFDEPFTGLDPHAIRRVRVILMENIRKGAAVVISSHLLGMVEDMVNHVIILNQGRKMIQGSIEELRQALKINGHEDSQSTNSTADLEEIFIQLTRPESSSPIEEGSAS